MLERKHLLSVRLINLKKRSDSWKTVKYKTGKISPSVFIELIMAAYFLMGVYMCFLFEDYSIMPFMLMEMLGFGLVGYYTLRHTFLKLRA